MKPILIDTSFLYALNDIGDRNRAKAHQFVSTNREFQFLVPQVVLPETAFMLQKHVGDVALLNFWQSLDSPHIQLESITKADLLRARDIRLQYADARFDFVDCCIMALAERMNITQICTFDHRDFAMVRPAHAEFLELLP